MKRWLIPHIASYAMWIAGLIVMSSIVFWPGFIVFTAGLLLGFSTLVPLCESGKQSIESDMHKAIKAEHEAERRQDDAIEVLKGRFIKGELTMEQLADETGHILEGESPEERRLRYEHGPFSSAVIASAEAEYMPPPKMVREYSYPAAPGWPDTDPPIQCNLCGKLEAYDPKRGPYCKKCWRRQTEKQQKVLYDLEKQRMFPQRYVETENGCYICMGKGDCLCPDCANLTINEKRKAVGF